MLLAQLIDLYSLIVLGAVIISWFQLQPTHPVAIFLRTLTEPALNQIRRIMPPMGAFDFSPFVLLFVLNFIKGFF
jgi:YggT family protein